MKEQNLKQINNLFFEFFPLFHQKLGPVFHKHNEDNKCNKNQNKAIMLIGRHNKITPSKLGKYLDLRKGSLTTLIDSLEKMNLVEREIDPSDRRKTLLHLTSQGKEYLKLRNLEFEQNLINLFDKLSEKEIEDFAYSLKQVVNTMKKI
ncbi:MarR family winged helix-turn-helix transcriptional regulator [Brassicibacter mesophilus]|uniref:MarR family winged helix-turn-helix transcriptional regulator n=1 Tax=Brassicibacter mesophilus TaxID=745119 RepID=UPI003D1B7AB6